MVGGDGGLRAAWAEPEAPALSREAEGALQRWADARAWQRAADQGLSRLALTHTQFLVLLGAAVATAERGDAVMQQDIADAAGLDKGTTSQVVRKLGEAGLLDKNINGVDDRKWRVLVTRSGWATLQRACTVVNAIAASLEPASGGD
jgi:DNA-binding MarR family transcriptional regulator